MAAKWLRSPHLPKLARHSFHIASTCGQHRPTRPQLGPNIASTYLNMRQTCPKMTPDVALTRPQQNGPQRGLTMPNHRNSTFSTFSIFPLTASLAGGQLSGTSLTWLISAMSWPQHIILCKVGINLCHHDLRWPQRGQTQPQHGHYAYAMCGPLLHRYITVSSGISLLRTGCLTIAHGPTWPQPRPTNMATCPQDGHDLALTQPCPT